MHRYKDYLISIINGRKEQGTGQYVCNMLLFRF